MSYCSRSCRRRFLLRVCLTYWPTKYNTRVNPTSINHTKFEVDKTIHCRVIAFLSADTSRDFETLTSDLLILNSSCAWRVMCPTLLPSLKTLRLSVLDLWVITFPISYHWKCVRGHCACAESRDPWVGGKKELHFWNSRPRFVYTLGSFGGSTIKVTKVICENNSQPCFKRRMRFCACAKSRDVLKVPEISYCSRSRRRRFTVMDFKRSAYSRIYGHFHQRLYCACAETVIYELPV